MRHEWATGEESRYGIYVLRRVMAYGTYTVGTRLAPALLSSTSKEGIGVAIVEHRADGDITDQTPVGILDGIEGRWVVSPYARGDVRRAVL